MAVASTITVVIPTYSEPDRLGRLLSTLSRQRYPVAAVDIVVVDDGSPQPLPEALLAKALPLRASLFRHETNQGRAQARNTGLAHAQGELIVFLDSDMTADSGLLRAHANAHQRTTRRVVIGNIRFSPELPPSALSRYLDGRGVHGVDSGQGIPFKCFVTGNSSVRLQLLQDAGFFDTGFSHYGGEDLELGYRLHRLGAEFRYAAQAMTHHHHCRTLPELCQLMGIYGRHSMPLLLAKHPELAGLLRVDFVNDKSLRSLFQRLALAGLVHHPIRSLASALSGISLPPILLDYLIWSTRTRAYLAARRASANA